MFGNHDNVDPCDPKFSREGVPHPECLKKIILEEGGDPKGTGFKKISQGVSGAKSHVRDVSKYSKSAPAWDILFIIIPIAIQLILMTINLLLKE